MCLLHKPFGRFLSVLGFAFFACLSINANAVVFQAESYNAFYDTTPGNTGGAFRNDAVDIEPTTDNGGGFNVGWVVAGEWLA